MAAFFRQMIAVQAYESFKCFPQEDWHSVCLKESSRSYTVCVNDRLNWGLTKDENEHGTKTKIEQGF